MKRRGERERERKDDEEEEDEEEEGVYPPPPHLPCRGPSLTSTPPPSSAPSYPRLLSSCPSLSSYTLPFSSPFLISSPPLLPYVRLLLSSTPILSSLISSISQHLFCFASNCLRHDLDAGAELAREAACPTPASP
eukprot:6865441-Pyramimonas_sp.AAC.1